MHLTLRLPARISDQTLTEHALAKGLNPRALSGFALQPRADTNGLVIGYGSTPAEQLAPAVGVLAGLAAELDGKPKRRSSEASSAKLRV